MGCFGIWRFWPTNGRIEHTEQPRLMSGSPAQQSTPTLNDQKRTGKTMEKVSCIKQEVFLTQQVPNFLRKGRLDMWTSPCPHQPERQTLVDHWDVEHLEKWAQRWSRTSYGSYWQKSIKAKAQLKVVLSEILWILCTVQQLYNIVSLVHCWQPMSTAGVPMFRPILAPIWNANNNRRSPSTSKHWYYKDFANPFGISWNIQARTSTSVESELTWKASIGHDHVGRTQNWDPEMD